MKNFIKSSILFLAMIALTVCGAHAQSSTPTSWAQYSNGTGLNYVVCTNTATVYLYSPKISASGYHGLINAVPTITNASGTTAGNVLLQGSLDSLTWFPVITGNGIYPQTADTLKTSATLLAAQFYVNPVRFNYLRFQWLGSGTHSDTLRAKSSVWMDR